MLKPKSPPQQARAINQKINKIFEEADINPTPMNYLVWFHYFLNENTDLIREINALPNGAKSYYDRLGVRLYEQFIEPEESKEEAQYDYAVKKLVDATLFNMNQLSSGMDMQSHSIEGLVNDIKSAGGNKKDLAAIADSIMEATKAMQQHTSQIHEEVQSRSDEVRELRRKLVEAKKESLTDDLTRIGNRKLFNNLIQDLTLKQKYQPEPICLIMTDIDHFKSFNDTYGHTVGDSVLRYYANILKENLTEQEHVCRYGGEEFAIILRNTSLDEAAQRAEKIRKSIASARLTLKGSKEPIKTITASFGVSFFRGDDDNFENFIDRADKSLYAAKEAGRNTVKLETVSI